MIDLNQALGAIDNIGLLDAVRRASSNNGVLYFDLCTGKISELEREISVKLIVLRDPRDYISTPEDRIVENSDFAEEEPEEIEGTIEELKNAGRDELEVWALAKEKELRADWKNRIKDFYALQGLQKIFKVDGGTGPKTPESI